MGLCFVVYAHSVDFLLVNAISKAADTAVRAVYRQSTEGISVTARHVEKRPRKTKSGHRHQELCISKALCMFEAVYVRGYFPVTIHEIWTPASGIKSCAFLRSCACLRRCFVAYLRKASARGFCSTSGGGVRPGIVSCGYPQGPL